jgi:hypothetical protein
VCEASGVVFSGDEVGVVYCTIGTVQGAFHCEQMIEPLEEVDGGEIYKREIRKLLFCKKICYGGLWYTDITFSFIDWLI